jgi:hypothetical protein
MPMSLNRTGVIERDDSRDNASGCEPPDDGGRTYGNRDHPRGGDARRA